MKNFIKLGIIGFASIIIVSTGKAQSYPPLTFGKYLHNYVYASGAYIGVNESSANITDLREGDATFGDLEVKNTIRLSFDQSKGTYLTGTETYEVKVQIKYTKINFASPITHTIVNSTVDKILTITHDETNGDVYNDIDEFIMYDAYRFEAKILYIKLTTGGSTSTLTSYTGLPKNLLLSFETKIDRYYDFDPNTATEDLLVNYNSTNNHIVASNFFIDGATAYDIEWTYVNDYSLTSLATETPTSNLDYYFKNNSSRIRVYSDEPIEIPAVFDRGYVIFRVRGIGRLNSNRTLEIYGAWSITDNFDDGLYNKKKISTITGDLVNSYIRIGDTGKPIHEANKNWMFQTTFAEEGKMKNVITYYDGLYRNRQAVTQVTITDGTDANGQKEAVVAETIYDRQGRAAVQSIPVPVPRLETEDGDKTIKYYENFNLSDDPELTEDAKYSYADFDSDEDDICNPILNGFKNTSGAAYYYSSSNNLKSNFYGYLPDAQAFPFTLVQYTPDKTGRITKQTGVGVDHNLLSDHVTTYFYAKPTQEELDRIFGNDAGVAEHYKKNAILDPNGQVSVSYIDMKGNVIATALAGITPNNVTDLKDAEGNDLYTETKSTLTIDLLNKSEFYPDGALNPISLDGKSTSLNTTLLVTEVSDYDFVYSLTELAYTESCLDDICLDCVYDLEISILDNCGNQVLNTGTGEKFVITIGDVPLEDGSEGSLSCVTEGTFITSDEYATVFSVTDLPIGVYTINKTLKLNETALTNYTNLYIESMISLGERENCYIDLSTFVDDYTEEINALDCEIDCEYCSSSEMASLDNFLTANTPGVDPLTAIEIETFTAVYYDLIAVCENLCEDNGSDICDATAIMLLQDISLGGQYGEYINGVGAVDASGYDLSVFNETNNLPARDINGDFDFVDYVDIINPSWRTPMRKIDGLWESGYFELGPDEELIRTLIPLSTSSDFPYDKPVLPGSPVIFIDDIPYGYPENLLYLSDFIAELPLHADWLQSLLIFHPEYYYYEYCIEQKSCLETVTIDISPSTTKELNHFGFNDHLFSISRTEAFDLDYLDELDNIVDADPIFADATCGFTGMDYDWVGADFETILTNFETCDGGGTPETFTIFEYVWLINHAGVIYGGDCDDIVVGAIPGTIADLITNEVDWDLFVTLYTTAKQNYLYNLSEYYAHSKFGLNGCIGNNAFNYGEEAVVFPATPAEIEDIYFNENHLCSYPRNEELFEKTKRFNSSGDIYGIGPSVDDDELTAALEDVLAESDYAFYVSSGNMPLSGDILLFLQGLLQVPAYNFETTNLDIIDNPQLTTRLFETLDAALGAVSPVTDWDPSITGNLLEWKKGANVILSLTIVGAYDWSDISVLSFESFTTTNAALGEFEIGITFTDGIVNMSGVLNGETIIPIDDDAFLTTAIDCELTPAANNLVALMNYILAENQFGSSAYGLTHATSEIFQSELAPYLGYLPLADEFVWSSISGTQFQLTNSDNSDYIQIDFASFPTIADVEYIIDFTGVSATEGMVNDFEAIAYKTGGLTTPISGTITFVGAASGDVQVADCGYPDVSVDFSADCDDLEVIFAGQLLDLLDKLATEDLLTEDAHTDLTGYAEWTTTLANYFDAIGYLTGYHTDVVYAGEDILHATLSYFSGDPQFETILCNFTLVIDDPAIPFTFSDVIGFENLVADFSYAGGSPSTNNFTITAITATGTFEVHGYGCLPLKNCICGEEGLDETYDPFIICDPEYAEYPTVSAGNDCVDQLLSIATYNATEAYWNYIDELRSNFQANYIAHCMTAIETFTYMFESSEYHYTLYYYDQAGNLIQTVPPIGVSLLSNTELTEQSNYRRGVSGNDAQYPTHSFNTNYQYNTLNELVSQHTPDAGQSNFWYDKLGRLVLSQNAKQNALYYDAEDIDFEKYSYTAYDDLGRIEEVGELWAAIDLETTPGFEDELNENNFPYEIAAYRYEVTLANYDVATDLAVDPDFGVDGQENLRMRVASIFYQDIYDPALTTYNHATFYSYDIHGNVKKIIQDNKTLAADHPDEQFKTIAYTYDLISGNVNLVAYQPGEIDQFFHQYIYDNDNRLYEVFTSRDGEIWDRDARYWYYRHGPLARVETGDLMVQGTDYAYTITGWLKGINSSGLNENKDIGRDGKSGVNHQLVGKDAFSFILDYFQNDYLRINTGVTDFIADAGTALAEYPGYGTGDGEQGLFNGNIHAMSTQFRTSDHTSGTHDISEILGKIYSYDQLNRLIESKGVIKSNIHTTGNYTWDVGASSTDKWATAYVYDPNGNILNMKRAGNLIASAYDMDDLTYHYDTDNNRLLYVEDGVSSSVYLDIDIDNQTSGNYDYDAIGNLVQDTQGGITSIEWTVYGKIKKVIKTSGDELTFAYDATGNRIMKKFEPSTGPTIYTYYTRDAQGNVMATYLREEGATDSIFLSEQHIYGSKRLGYVEIRQEMLATLPTDGIFSRYLGNKRYELTNHLGNVMVVLSDRRFMFQDGTTGNVLYYEPDIIAAQDYDPFGMLLVDRTLQSTTTYNYGFNGKENIDDVYGNDAAVDFGARIYDARLGRWFCVDKMEINYVGNSPFIFGLNNPIIFIDTDGKGILGYSQLTINNTGSPVSAAQVLEAGNFQEGYLTDNFGVGGTNNKNNLDISFLTVVGLTNPTTGATISGMTGVFVITVSGGQVDLGTYVDDPNDPTDNVASFEIAVKIESIDAPENQAESVIHEVTIHAINYKNLIDEYYSNGNISQLVSAYNALVANPVITNHQDIGNYSGDFAKVCGAVIEGLTGPTYSNANFDYGYENSNNLDNNGNYIISPNAKKYSDSGGKNAQVTKNTVVNQFIYYTNNDISNYDSTNSKTVEYVWTPDK